MVITVNGQRREVTGGSSIQDLLNQFQLTQERVAVEKNGTIIERVNYEHTLLSEGDTVEIVRFVGGG
ncbi:sulfur carrier protein ThiS [Alicyclobacillus pomorum]|jgi:sulfur carrier protein|uniref:sulfur carrier protein ThiS n=1 Tax=Alicyclobacillus pomorum TaxID=204470 RepID=UPI00041D5F7A|nr:sulfur carrier protein ThiS [Alicyclobacillus pomorum]